MFLLKSEKKDTKQNSYTPVKQRKSKEKEEESLDFRIFENRENIVLEIKRDLFFLPEEKPKIVVAPPVVHPPKPQVKPEIRRPEPPKPVIENDSVKIKREMNKVQFLGFYENGNSKNIFIQYMGQDYEFKNKGEIEIFIDGKTYDLEIEMIDNSNIRIQEKTRNVYLNKGL